jgi:hypothetical protein
VSAVLVTALLLVLLRFALVAVVVGVALKTRDTARRRTALAVLKILMPDRAGQIVPALTRRRDGAPS